MQRKTFLGIFLLTSIFYYIIPLLFLKFYNGTSDKAGFILILVYGFTSFAITLLPNSMRFHFVDFPVQCIFSFLFIIFHQEK